jgi:hypothetical protein
MQPINSSATPHVHSNTSVEFKSTNLWANILHQPLPAARPRQLVLVLICRGTSVAAPRFSVPENVPNCCLTTCLDAMIKQRLSCACHTSDIQSTQLEHRRAFPRGAFRSRGKHLICASSLLRLGHLQTNKCGLKNVQLGVANDNGYSNCAYAGICASKQMCITQASQKQLQRWRQLKGCSLGLTLPNLRG